MMEVVPKYYALCPHVDWSFSVPRGLLVLSARRWTSDGEATTPDGLFLWDRADRILNWPVEAADLGLALKTTLTASRQLKKVTPKLPPPLRETLELSDDAIQRDFYPGVVWTHRDLTTPYVVGAAISNRVELELLTVPKQLSDSDFGSRVAAFLAHVGQLAWET